MKILVPVERAGYNAKVRMKSDGTGVDIANVKMSMNPFDEVAVVGDRSADDRQAFPPLAQKVRIRVCMNEYA
jgi:hypothetical protein